MYELRVLSGLHRGATLPIDDQPYIIGASDVADVVLVDPDVEERHASLSLGANGWSIASLDGKVLGAANNQPHDEIELALGEFARVGKVWLTVVEQDAPWENPPPEPDDRHVDTGEDMISVSDLAEVPDEEEALEAVAEQPGAVIVNKGKRGRRVVYISLAVATVLSAAASYAITSRPAQEPKALDVRTELAMQERGESRKRLDAPLEEQALTPEALRQAFRKRLSDADLLKRFDLKLGDDEWTMQAALDDEEAARFERILAAFVKSHNISFPIHAKVGSGEAMLPFKIRQVVTGANASIVTQDGYRMYVGEEYKGVRLAAVDGSRLTFTGKRRIDIKW